MTHFTVSVQRHLRLAQSCSCIAGQFLSYIAWRINSKKFTGDFVLQILCTERLTAEKQTLWRMRASHQTSTRSYRHTAICFRHCQNATRATLLGARPLLGWPTVRVSRHTHVPLAAQLTPHCRCTMLQFARAGVRAWKLLVRLSWTERGLL